jgi:hypothetical protein
MFRKSNQFIPFAQILHKFEIDFALCVHKTNIVVIRSFEL